MQVTEEEIHWINISSYLKNKACNSLNQDYEELHSAFEYQPTNCCLRLASFHLALGMEEFGRSCLAQKVMDPLTNFIPRH